MERNRIMGAVRQARGALKEAVGKLTGDAILSGDGRADRLEGRVQSAIGNAKRCRSAALTAHPTRTDFDPLPRSVMKRSSSLSSEALLGRVLSTGLIGAGHEPVSLYQRLPAADLSLVPGRKLVSTNTHRL